ncbi:hypothetical protein BU26DRAFT_89892 [Trematosphaeria pertusa]|uniref:Uncharacterized protein n=1 Tax=Trematosphaeria pertusa TaxID=390896 RepID=A0A6A6I3P5_9PLEO|nr:uncharacterized protein BU26DRAFT_89892 [Trematosphaeria pertusa]KAF2244951.1 hypothetical protein BU26DRAFT_89892 [Trematosphaeria pertusa]
MRPFLRSSLFLRSHYRRQPKKLKCVAFYIHFVIMLAIYCLASFSGYTTFSEVYFAPFHWNSPARPVWLWFLTERAFWSWSYLGTYEDYHFRQESRTVVDEIGTPLWTFTCETRYFPCFTLSQRPSECFGDLFRFRVFRTHCRHVEVGAFTPSKFFPKQSQNPHASTGRVMPPCSSNIIFSFSAPSHSLFRISKQLRSPISPPTTHLSANPCAQRCTAIPCEHHPP